MLTSNPNLSKPFCFLRFELGWVFANITPTPNHHPTQYPKGGVLVECWWGVRAPPHLRNPQCIRVFQEMLVRCWSVLAKFSFFALSKPKVALRQTISKDSSNSIIIERIQDFARHKVWVYSGQSPTLPGSLSKLHLCKRKRGRCITQKPLPLI